MAAIPRPRPRPTHLAPPSGTGTLACALRRSNGSIFQFHFPSFRPPPIFRAVSCHFPFSHFHFPSLAFSIHQNLSTLPIPISGIPRRLQTQSSPLTTVYHYANMPRDLDLQRGSYHPNPPQISVPRPEPEFHTHPHTIKIPNRESAIRISRIHNKTNHLPFSNRE